MAKKETMKMNPGESRWDGTLLSMLGVSICSMLVMALAVVVGIAVMVALVGTEGEPDPVMMLVGLLVFLVLTVVGTSWGSVILLKWDTKHTVISGQRLQFNGNTIGLTFNMFKWTFLTMITFGIYGLWMTIKLRQWQIKKTVSYPDGEEKKEVNPGVSKWDGTLLSMFGAIARFMLVMILTVVAGMAVMVALVGVGVEGEPDSVMMLVGALVFLALTFVGSSWGSVILLKWDTKHTVISGQRLQFNGNTVGLTFNMFKWTFLTMITFGIYGLWMPIKMRQWQIKKTVSYPDSEEDELPEITQEEIDEDDGMIIFQTVED